MALSIGSISGISSASMNGITPIHYPIENQAEVSDAYTDSMQTNGVSSVGGSIDAVPPVQYPTAQLTENRIAQLDESIRMEGEYNSIADEFSGYNTSYNSSMQGMSYSTVGSNIDVYA